MEDVPVVLEEESDAQRFSIYRLAHYCLDLAELMETTRAVPVVIFLRQAKSVTQRLRLSGDQVTYLDFHYLETFARCINFQFIKPPVFSINRLLVICSNEPEFICLLTDSGYF